MERSFFNFAGLISFFKTYYFKNITIKCAGYYPLFSKIGLIDPRHAGFITLKGYKILKPIDIEI